jgi:hypothetical protein
MVATEPSGKYPMDGSNLSREYPKGGLVKNKIFSPKIPLRGQTHTLMKAS